MQLTQLQRTANQREAGQSSWVELCRYRHFADATQLDVELSWAELCRYKRAFRISSPDLGRVVNTADPVCWNHEFVVVDPEAWPVIERHRSVKHVVGYAEYDRHDDD